MEVIGEELECPGVGGIATGSNSLPVAVQAPDINPFPQLQIGVKPYIENEFSLETLAVFVAGSFSRPGARRSAESVTPELRYIQDHHPLLYQRIEKDYLFDKEAKTSWSFIFKYRAQAEWSEPVLNFFLGNKEVAESIIDERQLYMERHIISVLRLRHQDIDKPIKNENFGATVRPHTSDSATQTWEKQFLHWRPSAHSIVSREFYPSSQRIIDTLPGAPGTLLRVGNLPGINVMDMRNIFESRDYNLYVPLHFS